MEAKDINLFLVHGASENGQWVTPDEHLKGVTVEQIVKAYEESTGQRIDVLLVCNPESGRRVRVVPFSSSYERPRIFIKKGLGYAYVELDEKTGEVSVDMSVDSKEDVEFEHWQKVRGRVKVIPGED